MQRDMDLIRLLLFELEGEQEVDLSGYTDEQKGYHRFLLADGGLAYGESLLGTGMDHPIAAITLLSWKGHDFLAAARDETRWRKVNATLGNAAFDAIKQTLVALTVAYGKSQLNLP